MARDHAETPVVLSRIYTRTGDDGSTGAGRRQPRGQDRPAAGRLRRRGRGQRGHRHGDHPGRAAGRDGRAAGPGPERAVRRRRRPVHAGRRRTRLPAAADHRELRDRAGAGLRPVERGPAGAAQLRAARRHGGHGAAAHGQDRGPPGRAEHLGGHRGARRGRAPAAGPLPEPAVRPAVHPGPPGRRAATSCSGSPAARGSQRGAGPRGAASSQARNPVRAASLMASSTGRRPPRCCTRPRSCPRRAGRPPSPAGPGER